MRWWLLGLAACAGCGVRLGDSIAANGHDGRPGDAPTPIDDGAPTVDAAPLGPFPAATPIAITIPGATGIDDDTVSSTGLELFFAPTIAGAKHLWTINRPSLASPWTGTPTALPIAAATGSDDTPRLSADDLTLYFESTRPGGPGAGDVWMVTRPSVGAAWGSPTLVPGLNTAVNERWFAPCAGGRYVEVHNVGVAPAIDMDLVEGTLGGGPPTPIAMLNSTSNETGTLLSPDCLTIYFTSQRNLTLDLFTASRSSIGAAWSTPTLIAPFDTTTHNEQDPFMSVDGRLFVYASDQSGANTLYSSSR